MSILYYEANEPWFPKSDMGNTGKEKLFTGSRMNVDAKILMEENNTLFEIDAENAFDNSESFYHISLHKPGIKKSFPYYGKRYTPNP